MDSIIETKEFQIERKHFHVEFRENDRGKIPAHYRGSHGRRNTIIVPSTGVDDFTAAIDDVLAAEPRGLSLRHAARGHSPRNARPLRSVR